MKKIFLILVAFFITSLILTSESSSASKDIYYRVQVFTTSTSDIQKLQQFDIDIDHYRGDAESGIIIEINQRDLELLKRTGLQFQILINDLERYYANLPSMNATEIFNSNAILQADNVSGFGFGSMGGYYTFEEVVKALDTLRALYPNLITAKQNIGTSQEGRIIWAVKLTQNPDVSHAATRPAVYYDGLHHAREPMSMAALIYYMFWLCENYGTNPEATYLLNNREIFFIPVVNPDGYVYNQSTNPIGGGMWRKNRRNNGSSFGVDLNRNYGYGWGIGSGSSNVPSSETYHGPAPFSEPETQAVWNYVQQINPSISFTMHSVAGRYLNPYGYTDTAIAYEKYSDFSGEFAASNNYLYGTAFEMLSYYSAGTTRDHFHVHGTLCWTVEVGGTGFWTAQSEIIPLCSENLPALKYLAWVSGAFARLQQVKEVQNSFAFPNDTLKLLTTVRNKGLRTTSQNVIVNVTSLSANAIVLTPSVNIDSIPKSEMRLNDTNPVLVKISNTAQIGTDFRLVFRVQQDDVTTSIDTVSFRVGRQEIIFSDDAESGNSKWIKGGTQNRWDTTFVGYYSPFHSFASARYGNAANNTQSTYTLADTISLANVQNPFLEFAARWADETTNDYTRIQISTNNGTTWLNLTGQYSKQVGGIPSYTDIRYWIRERISLAQYAGQNVRLRFFYRTNGSVPGDGFYFDDFRVVDYTDNPSSITQTGSELPATFNLGQNFPNPFNPETSIQFSLRDASFVKLNVYDVSGRLITSLVSEFKSAGTYNYSFNARGLSSGSYFYSLEAFSSVDGELIYREIKKMLLIK